MFISGSYLPRAPNIALSLTEPNIFSKAMKTREIAITIFDNGINHLHMIYNAKLIFQISLFIWLNKVQYHFDLFWNNLGEKFEKNKKKSYNSVVSYIFLIIYFSPVIMLWHLFMMMAYFFVSSSRYIIFTNIRVSWFETSLETFCPAQLFSHI